MIRKPQRALADFLGLNPGILTKIDCYRYRWSHLLYEVIPYGKLDRTRPSHYIKHLYQSTDYRIREIGSKSKLFVADK